MPWKLIASCVGALAVLGFIAWAMHEHGRADTEHAKVLKAERCEAAVAGALKLQPVVTLAAECPAATAAAARAAQMAKVCDQALAKGDLYAVRASCSTEVKTMQAARDAASANELAAKAELKRVQAQRQADIGRAEARGRNVAERKSRAADAVARAPRDSAGLLGCDAQCMRDRWQAGAPGDDAHP